MSGPLARVVGRLDKVKPNGKGYQARCPAHEDANPSLSVHEGEDGRVLLHCHAGCPPEAIAGALGLTLADLFEPKPKPLPPITSGPGELVATFDYRDEHGTVLYQVRRYQPKAFRQYRPDGRGGFTSGLDGVRRRPVYHLPELQGKRAVAVPEGEKDVDRLVLLGIPATCNSGGAGKWTADHAAQLVAAGVKRVAILEDNDDAGRQHALTVARTCYDAGVQVRIVRLPNLPPKGDVSDWLDAGNAPDELKRILRDTPVWSDEDRLQAEPTTATPTNAAHTSDEDRPFRELISVNLATVTPEPVTWLWKRRVPQGKLSVLCGNAGEGKSFIALDLAARVTTGREFPDGGNAPVGNVTLLACEDGTADTLVPRLIRLGADRARIEQIKSMRLGDSTRGVSLETDLEDVRRKVRERQSVLLIVDPLSAYLGEQSKHSYQDAEIRRLLGPLSQFAEDEHVAVLAILHLTKGTQATVLHRVNGSVAFGAAARVVLGAGPDPNDPERRYLVGIKSNIARAAATLAYGIEGPEDEGVLVWHPGECRVTAHDVFSAPAQGDHEGESAAAFFDSVLPPGAELPQREVMKQAEEYGLSRSTIHRWKHRLGIDSRKGGLRDGWLWFRPLPVAPEPPKVLTKVLISPEVSTFAGDPMKPIENTGLAPKVLTPPGSEYLREPVSTFGGPESASLPLGPVSPLREY